jgi:hypothetical protein
MGTSVDDSHSNFELCNCRDCPTARESPLSGALFCARGKAEEAVLEAGCMCSFCPVAEKYGLELEYYCIRGLSSKLP